MNFFKIIILLSYMLTTSIVLADNHDQKQEVLDKVNEIAKELENEEEVPLNDPFAGNEGTSSMSGNIPDDEQDNEFSLYNFKLAGLISGKDYSYISIVNSPFATIAPVESFCTTLIVSLSKFNIFFCLDTALLNLIYPRKLPFIS